MRFLQHVTIIFIVFGMFTFSFKGSAQQTELTGRDVMDKVYNRPEGEDSRTVMKMILVNRMNKTKERSILSFNKKYGKDRKLLMVFQAPANIRGTGFLSWEYDSAEKDDDRWLYLPALRKPRRISGRSKNDYFLGTDFTYDDLGGRSVDEDDHKLIKEEEVNGHKCWVIESWPKDKNDSYSKKISWIRQDALLAVKIEFYDRTEEVIKILTVQDLRKHEGYWTTFKMEMNNLKKEHKTVIIITDMKYNQGLEDQLFRVSTLERGLTK